MADSVPAPIVAGFDGTSAALRGVRWAAAEARLRDRPLRLVHCHDPGVLDSEDIPDESRERALRWRQQALTAARAVAPDLPIETALRRGPVVPCLLHESRHAAILVLGAAEHGAIPRLLLGSTAGTVATKAICPVAVIRGDQSRGPADGPVVVGVDGSPGSQAAVEFAIEEASLRGAGLVAVHAWRDPFAESVPVAAGDGLDLAEVERAERAVLAERVAGWREKYPDVPVREELVRDHSVHALLAAGGPAGTLVVGSRGRGGFTGLLLGSTATILLNQALRPVIVVGSGGKPN
jgi:nucleotide-binding universal stress UspA family protein